MCPEVTRTEKGPSWDPTPPRGSCLRKIRVQGYWRHGWCDGGDWWLKQSAVLLHLLLEWEVCWEAFTNPGKTGSARLKCGWPAGKWTLYRHTCLCTDHKGLLPPFSHSWMDWAFSGYHWKSCSFSPVWQRWGGWTSTIILIHLADASGYDSCFSLLSF